MDSPIFVNNMARLALPFIASVIALATLIIGLDCIWRMEKRLRTFMITLTLGVSLLIVRKVMLMLGFDASPSWYATAQLLDIGLITFFFLAFVEMYRIVRFLDHGEK
jgi:hypothetical protein